MINYSVYIDGAYIECLSQKPTQALLRIKKIYIYCCASHIIHQVVFGTTHCNSLHTVPRQNQTSLGHFWPTIDNSNKIQKHSYLFITHFKFQKQI